MAIYTCTAEVDMTQDEIIEMAVQAGMAEEIAAFNILIIEAFAKLVAAKAAAKERERTIELLKVLGQGWKKNPSADDSGFIALQNAIFELQARGEA